MLQIRLRRDSPTETGSGARPSPTETVTVACPDHLVLADLPVAKGIGSVTPTNVIKPVGRRSRRQLGERVHFCVRCDFPIAIYGRLNPCDHAFCLECARSDSICYLCDERIQKIQTIKMMEGIFICAAPHCLRSFLKKPDFESHVHHLHASLLLPDPSDKEDGNESDVQSTKQQSSASESTLRAPLRSQQPLLHRSSSLSKPLSGFGSYPADNDNSRPPGFETASPKPGIRFPDYPLPMNIMQPPTMPIPINALPQQFSFPPYPTADGSSQQFYNGAPFELARPEGSGSEHGSAPGYQQQSQQPAPMMNPSFQGSYPPQSSWNPGMAPPQTTQQANRGGRDAQGFGWQQDNRDGFGQE